MNNKKVQATGILIASPPRQPEHVAQPDTNPTLTKVETFVDIQNTHFVSPQQAAPNPDDGFVDYRDSVAGNHKI